MCRVDGGLVDDWGEAVGEAGVVGERRVDRSTCPSFGGSEGGRVDASCGCSADWEDWCGGGSREERMSSSAARK